MRHYPHHIGDFNGATRHLSRIERSIYRDLMDLYYDSEKPLTLDRHALCRLVIARSNEEATAVEQVLNEFFVETPSGWFNERCEAEIAAYKANNSQKAMAGKASAEAKRLRKQQALNSRSTGVATAVEQPLHSVDTAGNGASTNQSTNEPINLKEKETPPTPSRGSSLSAKDLKAEGVDAQHAADWLAVRKAKRLPLTATAWDETKAEAAKAGVTPAEAVRLSAVNGWGGFKATWLANQQSQGQAHNVRPLNRQIAIEEENARVAREWVADMKAAQQ